MKRVRLFSDFGGHTFLLDLLKRQTKGFVGDCFEGVQFVGDESYEYAVCFNSANERLKTPARNNFCFVMEPPEIFVLPPNSFLDQISLYHTPVEKALEVLKNRGRKDDMTVLLHTFPDYRDVAIEQKPRKMSMIVSGKSSTPYQAKRYALFQALLKTDLSIDFYGRKLPITDSRIKGELPRLDKRSGLVDYRFSIACENTSHAGCISEKFYDCVVNNCIPITNAPGAYSRFKDSCVYLDFDLSIEQLVEIVRQVSQWDAAKISSYRKPLAALKTAFTAGELSLAKKIVKLVL